MSQGKSGNGSSNGGNGSGRSTSGGGDEHALALEPGLRALEVVGEFLDRDGWHPEPLEETRAFRVQCTGKNASFACFVQVRIELQQVLVYAACPVRVPEPARTLAAEFITRANYGMRIGNFELDFDDGEVRFKTSLDFDGEELTPGMVRNLLYPAAQTLDVYLPGLLAVSHGEKTPLEAIQAIEHADG